MAFQRAHARAAHADLFHGAFRVGHFDMVANPKWFVGKHRNRAEQIRQRVLRCQSNCEAAD